MSSKFNGRYHQTSPIRHTHHSVLDTAHNEYKSCINSPKNIVKYVLSAEFDNRIGPILKHQIPRKIPGIKENLSHLADLMLPTNTEHNTSEDYTVFILYKDSNKKYGILPDTDIDLNEDGLGLQHIGLNVINTINETSFNDDDDEESEPLIYDNDDVLFFLNVTKTVQSEENERGAIIKSIAIGTPLRNFIIFKPIITMAIQSYIVDGLISHLINLFNVINGTDISIWKSYLTVNSELPKILSLNYDFNNRLILSHFKDVKRKDTNTQLVSYQNGTLKYLTSYKEEFGSFGNDAHLSKIPLNLSLHHYSEEISIDLNIYPKLLKFMLTLSYKLNQIDYKNFKILIYSKNETTDFISQFVLSLSNFMNGFNNTYFHNDKILYFPLVDLYNWEKILEFDKHTQNTKIIGTNNIILRDDTSNYDFFYDLDSEEVILSDQIQTYPKSINKTFDFMELLNELVIDHHDKNTIRLSLQRYNVWQILKILNRDIESLPNNEISNDQNELNLKDYYLSVNKNLVIFDNFFDFSMIRIIDSLNEYLKISKRILLLKPKNSEKLEITPITPTRQKFSTPASSANSINSNSFQNESISEIPISRLKDEHISKLIEIYQTLNGYLSKNVKKHLENFVFLLEIFPIGVKDSKDLLFDVGKLKTISSMSSPHKPLDFQTNFKLQQNNNSKPEMINEIFKSIFIKNVKLQRSVWKLYDFLNKSSLKIVIEQRLDIFVRIALEEFNLTHGQHIKDSTSLPHSMRSLSLRE